MRIFALPEAEVKVRGYWGKVVLVVNVASFCGYTVQYGGLEKLHREFVTEKFSVTFPMFAKSTIQPGAEQSPAFAFLGSPGKVPKWNIGKYLVGKDVQAEDVQGEAHAVTSSRTSPSRWRPP